MVFLSRWFPWDFELPITAPFPLPGLRGTAPGAENARAIPHGGRAWMSAAPAGRQAFGKCCGSPGG